MIGNGQEANTDRKHGTKAGPTGKSSENRLAHDAVENMAFGSGAACTASLVTLSDPLWCASSIVSICREDVTKRLPRVIETRIAIPVLTLR